MIAVGMIVTQLTLDIRRSGCFDRVIIATDDEEILETGCSLDGVTGHLVPPIPDDQRPTPTLDSAGMTNTLCCMLFILDLICAMSWSEGSSWCGTCA